MQKQLTLSVSPEMAADENLLKQCVRDELGLKTDSVLTVKLRKRSVDSRSRKIRVNLSIEVFIDEVPDPVNFPYPYRDADPTNSVAIIGAGPAGLFAALKLLEHGIRPVIFERGKDVRARRRDLASINKEHVVNPESNYCFGEGGAGTYSDGKLYTRSNKRGDVQEILNVFIAHGASEEIAIDAHPHIGTNKLPAIIVKMRETILRHGGEIHFNAKLTDFQIKNKIVEGIDVFHLEKNQTILYSFKQIIVATGHSARDIYELFQSKNLKLEAKPFALGVRIEHPQSVIDSAQYHCNTIVELNKIRQYLPAASYSLAHQFNGRGVYSFCMCPGGIIAPCATAQDEVVTNGWSPSRRNNPFANSGMVVAVGESDFAPFSKARELSGLRFQQLVEQKAWEAGGKTQTAPAQRLIDFINKKTSSDLPQCSYQPGITSVQLNEVLGNELTRALREGLSVFGKKMRSYLTNEAVLVATESRTSTPVRIPRDPQTLMHIDAEGLYPCGEGAGYAGGIMSAAMDGQKVANAIVSLLHCG